MIFIRRSHGCFVQCKNEAKARRRATHWHRTGQGDHGAQHPIIGLFFAKGWLAEAKRIELYG